MAIIPLPPIRARASDIFYMLKACIFQSVTQKCWAEPAWVAKGKQQNKQCGPALWEGGDHWARVSEKKMAPILRYFQTLTPSEPRWLQERPSPIELLKHKENGFYGARAWFCTVNEKIDQNADFCSKTRASWHFSEWVSAIAELVLHHQQVWASGTIIFGCTTSWDNTISESFYCYVLTSLGEQKNVKFEGWVIHSGSNAHGPAGMMPPKLNAITKHCMWVLLCSIFVNKTVVCVIRLQTLVVQVWEHRRQVRGLHDTGSHSAVTTFASESWFDDFSALQVLNPVTAVTVLQTTMSRWEKRHRHYTLQPLSNALVLK